MKEYKVSWTDIKGIEFFSEEYGTIKLCNYIVKFTLIKLIMNK